LRSGREIPRRQQRAVSALLPRTRAAIPVLRSGMPPSRLARRAEPLHHLRQSGGGPALQRDAGNGPLASLARRARSLHRNAPNGWLIHGALLPAADELARNPKPRPSMRLGWNELTRPTTALDGNAALFKER